MESRLTWIEDAGENKHRQPIGRCRCVCGTERTLAKSLVRTHKVLSCGCLKSDKVRERWRAIREAGVARQLVAAANGCLEWRGAVTEQGYGVVGRDGRTWRTHRLAWVEAKGPIPKGKMVLHRCDNPPCCNPDHLYLGDHQRNMQDVVERGNRKGINAGTKNGRAKLDEDSVKLIRDLYAGGNISQDQLGKLFGVSQFAVSAIVRGKRYV